jgi:hypothetical protein
MCEPTLLTVATMGLQAGSAVFSAGMQSRNGARQARLGVWQALQESKAGFEEAGAVSRVLVDEATETAGFTLDQAVRATRAYKLAMDMAGKNAELAMSRANLQENRVREETKAALAEQSTYFAANNMDPTYGSPLALAAFGAAQGESDAMIVRAGGLQEAAEQRWTAYSMADKADESLATAAFSIESGYKTASRQIDSSYRTAKTRGTFGNTAAGITAANNLRAGQFGAATTLLSTATNWASMAMGGKLPGISFGTGKPAVTGGSMSP